MNICRGINTWYGFSEPQRYYATHVTDHTKAEGTEVGFHFRQDLFYLPWNGGRESILFGTCTLC